MKALDNPEFKRVLTALRDCKSPDQKVYVVGGAVRDLLLGKALHDFDYVMAKGSRELAKALRKALGGASFALDDERGFNRVILDGGSSQERHIDIAEFVGETLEEDLRARDFTINAMAIDIDEPDVLIDPLGGKEDLKNGILQVASADSFEKDPLRVLRAVRMLQTYEMGLSSETAHSLRVAISGLERVSGERVRDELFNILNVPSNEDSFRMMWYLGILSEVFPCVPPFSTEDASTSNQAFERRLSRVAHLEDYFLHLNLPELNHAIDSPRKTSHECFLNWCDELIEFINRQITRGRLVRNLLVLLVLLLRQDVKEGAPSSVQAVIHHYKLSKAEGDFLTSIENAFLSELAQITRTRVLTDLEVFKTLKQLKSALPGFVFVSMAFADDEKREMLSEEAYQMHQSNMQSLLKAWFERGDEIIKPKLIMDGDAIMQYGGLAPGPFVGELLDILEEAQFLGKIKSLEDAKALIDQQLAR
jgi:poly(A) polymerase